MRIPHPQINRGPPLPPHYAIFGQTKGGIFKSCPRIPELRVWLLRGWGRCLKVTLQTCAPEKFPLVLMGGRAEGLASTDPEAPAEIMIIIIINGTFNHTIYQQNLKRMVLKFVLYSFRCFKPEYITIKWIYDFSHKFCFILNPLLFRKSFIFTWKIIHYLLFWQQYYS